MKPFILILSLVFFTNTLKSQNYLKSQDEKTIAYFSTGYSQKAKLTLGMSIRNLYKGYGFYMRADGLGGAYIGQTGDRGFYRLDADRYEVKEMGVVEEVYSGYVGGVTIDISKYLKLSSNTLSVFTGLGYAKYEVANEKKEYYYYNCCPNNYETNIVTYLSKHETKMSAELLLAYDLLKKDILRLSISGGYNTTNGYIAQLSIGIVF